MRNERGGEAQIPSGKKREVSPLAEIVNALPPTFIMTFKENAENAVNKQYYQCEGRGIEASSISRIIIERTPAFGSLSEFTQNAARRAQTVLSVAYTNGYLQDQHFRHIADFGAGAGGPTFALVASAKEVGGQVVAVENTPSAEEIIATGILPKEQVIKEDGIVHFTSLRDAAPDKKYSMITAFMLGPDFSGNLFRNVMASAKDALTEDGKLLITSDIGTIQTIREICQQAHISTSTIESIGEELPGTIILEKKDCRVVLPATPEIKNMRGYPREDTLGRVWKGGPLEEILRDLAKKYRDLPVEDFPPPQQGMLPLYIRHEDNK